MEPPTAVAVALGSFPPPIDEETTNKCPECDVYRALGKSECPLCHRKFEEE